MWKKINKAVNKVIKNFNKSNFWAESKIKVN